jgi:hypothetical protein
MKHWQALLNKAPGKRWEGWARKNKEEKKSCINLFIFKIKDRNPSIKSTRQMKAQVDTTQSKNKRKQSTKKKGKNCMQIGPMAMK